MNPVPAVQAPQGSTSGAPEFTAKAHACLEPPPPLQSDPQASPEACAEALLKSESPDMSSILAMCENLPWEKPHVDACSRGRAFYAGGYRKGGVFGLRKHCKDFPRVIRVLTALLRRTVPSIPFTSIAVLDEVQSGPHKDLMNSSSPNIVIPLSLFKGGGVWVEDISASEVREVHGCPMRGRVADFSLGHVLVPASTSYHQTEPWTGRRVVLIGYCLENKFSAQDAATLDSLGFPLPRDVGEAALPSSTPNPSLPEREVPMFIEICAGSAILASCFREVGWDIIAIDTKRNRFHPLAKICVLDLSLDTSWEYLRWVCKQFPVKWVHAAPPCGTSSRARERPGGPPPLRTDQEPWGKSDLIGTDADRVSAANFLYLALYDFVEFLNSCNIHWSIENPANSLLWQLDPYQALVSSHCKVDMQTCAFGGTRPTWKSFLTSLPQFQVLGLTCPGNHEHAAYGRKRLPSGAMHFATSEEAVYPREMCRQIVQLVSRELGIHLLDLATAPSQSHLFAAAAGRQARGHRRPVVLSEFESVFSHECSQLPPVDLKRCVLANELGLQPGMKLLSYSLKGDVAADKSFLCTFGVYRSKEKFLQESMSAPHPFFDVLPLSDSSKRVLFKMLTKGPAWVAGFRAQTLKRWTRMANDLKLRELELHKSLDPKIRAVLKGKRLLLWRKIAEEVGWADMTLFDQIEQGFELVGHRPASGIFPLEMRPAEQTPEQLMRRSGFLKSSLLQKVSSAPRNDDADELRRITMKEVEAGSLDGPHPPEVMDERFPDGWIPVRRFGVWQSSADKTKLRPIDDFAEAEVNSAFAYVDKLDLRSIDTLVAMLRWWTVCCDVTAQVKVSLSDGTCLEGSVHHAWKDQEASAPLLSTMDLRNAYKQLPLNPNSRRLAVCTLPKPGGGVECYESQALPFGATASVVDFNRFARFLHHVGECLLVPWVNYFDDYPVWTPAALARSTDLTLRALVELMGVDCAWDKMPAFSPVCPMLGIELDVSDLRGQGLLIRNKPGRVAEVEALVRSCLKVGAVESRDLLKMLGRIQFADSHVMGRAGKLALADIRTWSRCHERKVLISPAISSAFEVLLNRLTSGAPRCVPCGPGQQPVLLFTDGASESRCHTVGGLLVRPGGSRPRFFACHVSEGLVESWTESLKRIIGPVECYAVAVARLVWHQFLAQKPCLHFIDNVACQDAFIRGTSCSAAVRSILLAYEKCELQDATWTCGI